MTSPTEGRARAHVVGLGLVGGSIALGLRAAGWAVTGEDLDDATTAAALDLGAIEGSHRDPNAPLVVVAVPSSHVVAVVRAQLSLGPRDVVVTDVAGVKAPLVDALEDPRYVGGHPMAGSEQSGLHGARADLFVGATWVLTPTAATTPERYAVLVAMVRALGATAIALTAEDHDRLVAMVSHVPHLVAGAMMNEAALLAESDAALLRLAAGGFRDMTRVAAGHPAIWPDVCVDNRDAILAGLAALRGRLATLEAAIAGKDRATILKELTSASAARRNLPASTPDPTDLAVLRVPVPDRPGVLAEVTTRRERGEPQHLRPRDRPLDRGDLGGAHHGARGRRRDHPRRAPRVARAPHRGRAAVSTARPEVPDVAELAPSLVVAGDVTTPGDKSVSHRAILLGALAAGRSTVVGLSDGEDVARTLACARALGASVEALDGGLAIDGGRDRLAASATALECGNSGTTMRLLCGVVATVLGPHHLDGDASLRRRPMDRVAAPLGDMGAGVDGHGSRCTPPLVVTGGALRAIHFRLPVASAQVKSAVLLAGLAGDGPTTVVEPVRTRVHTEAMLARAAARVEVTERPDGRHTTVWPSELQPVAWEVPGDPSQGSFFVVAALLAERGEVRVTGLDLSEERVGFLRALEQMGGHVVERHARRGTGDVLASSSALTGVGVPAALVPSLDEVPILAVAAAAAQGTTTFHDVGELRVKETDRLAATLRLVGALGATATTSGDELEVVGLGTARRFGRFEFDAEGDHRMAMAAAVAATVGSGGVVAGFAGVATSYPGFLADLASLR